MPPQTSMMNISHNLICLVEWPNCYVPGWFYSQCDTQKAYTHIPKNNNKMMINSYCNINFINYEMVLNKIWSFSFYRTRPEFSYKLSVSLNWMMNFFQFRFSFITFLTLVYNLNSIVWLFATNINLLIIRIAILNRCFFQPFGLNAIVFWHRSQVYLHWIKVKWFIISYST